MHKRLLLIILIVSLLKEIVWASIVPLWHFPDEQAHFGQVAYLAETGRQPFYKELDLTEEIRKSEELLGTERDELGINKFTYHPEYRIEYTNFQIGKYEEDIAKLAQDKQARRMVKQESTRYPSPYYLIFSHIYNLFYRESLFIRVFVIRLLQIIFSLGTVYVTFLIGRNIFVNNKFLALTLSVLVSFQPMFSFVSAGVNSDNIGNFIFSLYLLSAIKFLRDKPNRKTIIPLVAVTVLAVYIKAQFFVSILLTFLLLMYQFIGQLSNFRKRIKRLAVLSFSGILIGLILFRFEIAPTTVFLRGVYSFKPFSFLSYLKTYALPHAYHEVLPWYWGVYDWLGVTYPRFIHRIINWLGLFSLLGLSIWFLANIKTLSNWPARGIVFLLLSSILLFLGIYYYDWLEYSQREIHLGVQGRYFFPTISAHMTLFLLGWLTTFSLISPKWKFTLLKFLSFLMVLLNFYALYTTLKTYYIIFPFSTLIVQVGQYKPWFFKGTWLISIWFVYMIIIGIFLLLYLFYKQRNCQSISF